MKRYRVEVCQTGKYIEWECFEVEAESAEEAIDKGLAEQVRIGFGNSDTDYYDAEAPYVDDVRVIE